MSISGAGSTRSAPAHRSAAVTPEGEGTVIVVVGAPVVGTTSSGTVVSESGCEAAETEGRTGVSSATSGSAQLAEAVRATATLSAPKARRFGLGLKVHTGLRITPV